MLKHLLLKSIFIAALSCFSTSLYGQQSLDSEISQVKKELTPYQQIKNYGLCFRVKDYKKAIEQLESNGSYDRADELKKKAKEEKQAFIDGIDSTYQFSKAYFVNGSDIETLINGERNNLIYGASGNCVPYDSDAPIFEAHLTSDINRPNRSIPYFYIYKIENGQRTIVDNKHFPQGFKYSFPFFLRYYRLNTIEEKTAHLEEQLVERYEHLATRLAELKVRKELR